MKGRCRSLLALPSLFSSSPSSNESNASSYLNPNYNNNNNNNVINNNQSSSAHEKTRLFRSSNQNVNNISTTSSSSSNSHSSSPSKNAKRFFKSLLTSTSRESKSRQSKSQQNDIYHIIQDENNKSNCKLIDPPTPQVIEWLLADLFRRGPSTVGVFRKSPNARHCRELKQRLESVKDLRELDLDSYQVIVVASVFKEWLRSMPDCLLTSRLYSHWIDVARLISLEEEKSSAESQPAPCLQILKIVRQLLARLGENKLQLLCSFISVLRQIAQSSEYNKMSPINLGICVGQSLLVEDYLLASSKSLQRSKSRSKSRLELSAQSGGGLDSLACQASAGSAISCVPLLVAYLIENASLIFRDQLDECNRRHTRLASEISSLSLSQSPSSTSPSSAIESPTPSSSRPATPESADHNHRHHLDHLHQQQQQVSLMNDDCRQQTTSDTDHHHPGLMSGTPSPADSGRSTTSESSSSSSSSSSAEAAAANQSSSHYGQTQFEPELAGKFSADLRTTPSALKHRTYSSPIARTNMIFVSILKKSPQTGGASQIVIYNTLCTQL